MPIRLLLLFPESCPPPIEMLKRTISKAQNSQGPSNRAAFVVSLFQSRVKGIKVEDLAIDDVVVAVMGPTGSGKSSFIETVTGVTGKVGYGLESFTTEISIIKLSLSGLSLCFVDTPGFDDSNKSDLEVFKMISDWIIKTYRKQIRLTGLLYFHRISDNRMAGTPLKNLQIFEQLCGESFDKIVLTTTMWDEVDESVGAKREEELKQEYWKSMIELGSSVKRFLSTPESAFEVLTPIFDDVYRRSAVVLQKEMHDLGFQLTAAPGGKRSNMELKELVSRHQDIHGRIRNELKGSTDNSDQLQFLLEEHRKVSLELQRATAKLQIPNADRVYRIVTILDWTRLFSVFSLNKKDGEVDGVRVTELEMAVKMWKSKVEEKEQQCQIWEARAENLEEAMKKERELWKSKLDEKEQQGHMWEAQAKQSKETTEKERAMWKSMVGEKERQWELQAKKWKEAVEKETKERERWEARAKQLEHDAREKEQREREESDLLKAWTKQWDEEGKK